MRTPRSWLFALLGLAALVAGLSLRNADFAPGTRGRPPIPTATESPATAWVSTSTPPAGDGLEAAPSVDAPSATRPPAEGTHPGANADPAVIRARHGDAPLGALHRSLAAAISIQERNEAWLLAHPAVVGTGIGLNDAGDVALVVYTKADAPDLPTSVEGLPLAPFRSGPFVSRSQQTLDVPARPNAGAGPDPAQRFDRPVPIGVSTGHPAITAGTIGCRVRKDGQFFALSNNHVYANSNLAAVNDPVLQPGPFDGGGANDVIGTLFAFKPIEFYNPNAPPSVIPVNDIDAAIALTSTSLLGNSTPAGGGYGAPKESPVGATLFLQVTKYGRTTRQTTGWVGSINSTTIVNYGSDGSGQPQYARFTGQFVVSGMGFSAGGDSGSLIVTAGGFDPRRPVGLLFAGSSNTTIANPIGKVLAHFAVTIDGEAAGTPTPTPGPGPGPTPGPPPSFPTPPPPPPPPSFP